MFLVVKGVLHFLHPPPPPKKKKKLACFVLYLKIINTSLKITCVSYSIFFKEVKNGIAILVGQAVLKLWIKIVKMTFLSSGKASWLSAWTLSFHQCNKPVVVCDSIPALVCFLRVLWFPPTPKNRNPSIFLVHSFWFLVVCVFKACLATFGFNYLCVLRLSTQLVDKCVTKTANYYYYQ